MKGIKWLAVCGLFVCLSCSDTKTSERLHILCGAGLRPVIEPLCAAFTAESGIQTACDYAGSQVLLTRIRQSGVGDIYIPGDITYVEDAGEEYIREQVPLAWWMPTILVQKGNPKRITGLADLARTDVQLGLGHPETCAIGKKTVIVCTKNNLDSAGLFERAVYHSLTVDELAVHVKLGHIDACIIWDGTAALYADDCESIAIPLAQNSVSVVPVAFLQHSALPKQAQAFLDFCCSERGQEFFIRQGFLVTAPGAQ